MKPKYVIVELNGSIVTDALGEMGFQTYAMAKQKLNENPTWSIWTTNPFRPVLEIETKGEKWEEPCDG